MKHRLEEAQVGHARISAARNPLVYYPPGLHLTHLEWS